MTLAEFLLARIAEDEAQILSRDVWPHGSYIDGFSPARILAECEAKRRIVELHEGSHECSTYDHNGSVDNCTWVLDGDCSTMRLLALPYATHPDYEKT